MWALVIVVAALTLLVLPAPLFTMYSVFTKNLDLDFDSFATIWSSSVAVAMLMALTYYFWSCT
jgi:hypothetical protein